VIKHREGECCGIPSILYDNYGLEWGAYRSYVEHHWDGSSDVLFTHDDVEVTDSKAFKQVESLREMGVEQAYLFHDEYDEMVNGAAHGRGVWISGPTIAKLANDFPADLTNTGVNIGRFAQNGIFAFHKKIMSMGSNTGVVAIVPQFRFAFRGRIHEEMVVYRRTGTEPKGVVLVHE
jgi:hypothetical protein